MPLIINGEVVEDTLIREEGRRLRGQYADRLADMDPVEAEIQLRDWARESITDRILMRQEAQRDPEPLPPELVEEELRHIQGDAGGQIGCGLNTSPDDLRAEAETRARIQRLLLRLAREAGQPKTGEVSDFYRRHKQSFATGETVHAKHIVKNVDETHDETTARQVLEQAQTELAGGAGFEEVANRISDCSGNGGDLGYFGRGEMVDEFEAVVFALRTGETSPIFRSPFGFHIARVYDRKPPGLRSLEEVRDEIAQYLMRARQEQAIAKFLEEARGRATIQRSAKVTV